MTAITESSTKLVNELATLLLDRSWTVTTAESCTGGMIAAALTDVAGSSTWFNQGVISYSNKAKIDLLDVDEALLQQYGAVSEQVVEAMAAGACRAAGANIAIAISGIAGPGGGSKDKPVGTVWIAWALSSGNVSSAQFLFNGARNSVREAALMAALHGTIQCIRSA